MADVEHERVQAFVDQMCEATARLVRLPASDSTPVGVASGVLVPRQGVWRLLTAGHALRKTGIWCIETRVILSDERKTLLIKVGQPHFIARFTLTSEGAVEEEIDFAWVDMREQQLRDALLGTDIPKGTKVEVPLYLGPMTERPTKGEPYGFASWSNADMFEEKKVLLDKYTIVDQARTRTVYNWIQCFSPESIRAEFGENRLEIEGLHGDVAGADFSPDSEEFAVVAKRS